jgi:hemophore-related protein
VRSCAARAGRGLEYIDTGADKSWGFASPARKSLPFVFALRCVKTAYGSGAGNFENLKRGATYGVFRTHQAPRYCRRNCRHRDQRRNAFRGRRLGFRGLEKDPADPAPAPSPGCTAADLAQVSAGVAAGTSAYLFSHPDVNAYFTSLKGQPRSDQVDQVKQYMDANPQTHTDLEGIRQPLTDFRNRCNME